MGGKLLDSLFYEFNISEAVMLAGESDLSGLRKLNLKAILEPEQLARIPQFVRHVTTATDVEGEGISPLSADAAMVLELEYSQEGQVRKYYLIVDTKGIRTEPIPPPPPFVANFQAARVRFGPALDSERFGKLEILGQHDLLTKALTVIEPRLKRLAVVVRGGEPMIHGDIGLGRLIPLPYMGEGIARLASLVLAVSNSSDGIVLIDEIENGIHHSVMSQVWHVIGQVAQHFNTQVFATTHSLECIKAAHKAFAANGEYDFRLHRLERIEEDIRAITYNKEALEAAIDTGWRYVMASESVKIEQPKLLVVEGKDEELFMGALLDHMGLSNIQILPIGGKTQTRQNLEALQRSPGFSRVRCLGIVRDADSDPSAAFQSVCSAVQTCTLPVPRRPMEFAGSTPQVIIMILPEENIQGMLESVCLNAVSDDPAIPCLDQYFECLEKTNIDPPNNFAKARVHAFLASRKNQI